MNKTEYDEYDEVMIERIKEEAAGQAVPENLRPENMVNHLKEMQKEQKSLKSRQPDMQRGLTIGLMAAACLLIVISVSLFMRSYRLVQDDSAQDMAQNGTVRTIEETESAMTDGIGQGAEPNADGIEPNAGGTEPNAGGTDPNAKSTDQNAGSAAEGTARKEKKKDAGDLYKVADSYEEVYQLLQDSYVQMAMTYDADDVLDVEVERGTGYAEDVASAADTAAGAIMMGTAVQDLENSAMKKEAAAESESSFSSTNVQVTGVDESDIIKTDGKYIYTVTNDGVAITDIQGTSMKALEGIHIPSDDAAAYITEMYVEGNLLQLIVQTTETDIKKQSAPARVNGEVNAVVEDVYSFDSLYVTKILSYDISNPQSPKLIATSEQEGNYYSSRKIGSMLYLMTEQFMDGVSQTAYRKGAEDGFIPLVNGEKIAADCIYLPERGERALTVSSFDDNHPQQAVDSVMIINNYAQIYVSTQSLYLYHWDYSGEFSQTKIAKFSLKDGAINAVGAASVKGDVNDTFAVNETDGRFRILTTNQDWSNGGNENALYLFDETMHLTGNLEGLAKGEQVYAARFFGDIAYFVTYRNTDPLFAVDLSDETNPQVLSELKITGFSEYLHFWGEDKLLGIGYETDPDSGERKGIKVSMFDISDPANLSVISSIVIENASDSPAMNQYKSVLVSEKENMIGFAASKYSKSARGMECSYLLFGFENGKFEKIMTQSLPIDSYLNDYRGIYSGNRFYICNPEEISSYDREDAYHLNDSLKIE